MDRLAIPRSVLDRFVEIRSQFNMSQFTVLCVAYRGKNKAQFVRDMAKLCAVDPLDPRVVSAIEAARQEDQKDSS
jgi:hypothetical protein